MSLLKLPFVYKKAATLASRSLFRGWMLIPAVGLIAYGYELVYQTIASMQLGIAGGFLLGALQLAVITYVYSWFIEIRERQKISLEDLLTFDSALFLDIINAAFPIFVAEFIIQHLVTDINTLASVPLYLKLAIVFGLNPLPEVIIIERPSGLDAIATSFQFVKARLFEWFLPLVLLFAILMSLLPVSDGLLRSVVMLAQSEVLLPIELLFLILSALSFQLGALVFQISSSGIFTEIIPLIIGVIGACWFSLFRIELYDQLRS